MKPKRITTFQSIRDWFNRPVRYMTKIEAIVFIAYRVFDSPVYSSGLREEKRGTLFELSDTVTTEALNWLENEGLVTSSFQRIEITEGKFGQGRPRKVFVANPERLIELNELAELWRQHREP